MSSFRRERTEHKAPSDALGWSLPVDVVGAEDERPIQSKGPDAPNEEWSPPSGPAGTQESWPKTAKGFAFWYFLIPLLAIIAFALVVQRLD